MLAPLSSSPALPPDMRVYAIGDIHGRLDLLHKLMEKIESDAASSTVPVLKIFLGDYIDRGMQSKQVLDYLLVLEEQTNSAAKPVFLLGNHEQVMRELAKHGDEKLLQNWMRFGGRETMMSYGVRPPMVMMAGAHSKVIADFIAKVPEPHLDFLERMPSSISFGDYFFCHAGVRPNVPLAAQTEQDLVWIRGDFMMSTERHEKVIVHGHTICEAAEMLAHRINVDTGAYATGCLTAVALEGRRQWLVQTGK